MAVCDPAIGTMSQAAAHIRPSNPSAGMRLRPWTNRAIGSWSSTTTIVLTRKTIPICASETPASFFA